ncbi:MAG: haloacid dehalogenase-like hydrolase, partial [Candidatus Hadarchaeum sp.]
MAPNVKNVVGEIVRRGFQTAIITGGLDVLAGNVARDLGIPHIIANGLEVDKSGYLTGEGILRVEPRHKDKNLV